MTTIIHDTSKDLIQQKVRIYWVSSFLGFRSLSLQFNPGNIGVSRCKEEAELARLHSQSGLKAAWLQGLFLNYT